MADREKIIKGLEICEKKDCVLCPYKDEKDETYSGFCEQVLKQDALALLKEQDAVKPKKANNPDESEYCCGICGYPLWLDEFYCAHCGRRIEWESR